MEHGDFSSHTRCHPTPINIHAVTKIRHSKASFPTHAGTNAGEDPIIRSHPKLRLIILTKSSFHHTTKSTTEHSHFVNLYLVSHVRHERTELVDNPVVDGRRHRLKNQVSQSWELAMVTFQRWQCFMTWRDVVYWDWHRSPRSKVHVSGSWLVWGVMPNTPMRYLKYCYSKIDIIGRDQQ